MANEKVLIVEDRRENLVFLANQVLRPLGYEVINIGRGQPVRLGDFVDIIQEMVGKPAIVKSVEAPPSEPAITFASIEKAHRLLGYEPPTSIREGLVATWEWYQTLGN